MRQQRFIIEFSDEEVQLAEMFAEIRESSEYRSGKPGVLQLFTGIMNSQDALQRYETISEQLPGIRVFAMSVFCTDVFHPIKGYQANLVFTDEAGSSYSFIDFEGSDSSRVLGEADAFLESIPDIKAVFLLPAGNEFSHSIFIRHVTKTVPHAVVSGAGAGYTRSSDMVFDMSGNSLSFVDNLVSVDENTDFVLPFESYVICDGSIHNEGALILVFSGAELFADVEYVLGWKPIGKEMVVTSSRLNCHHIGDTEVLTIDGVPAADIYQRYLGVEPNKYFVTNICEFPFVVERDGMLQARVPFNYEDNGALVFNGELNEGERIRLSYANPIDLFTECKRASAQIHNMAPQATFLYICGNRTNFLKQKAIKEIHQFEKDSPQLGAVYGHYEILGRDGKGGLLNSALVAVSMREGSRPKDWECTHHEEECEMPDMAVAIPLELRMIHFLDATTSELKEALVAAQESARAKSAFLSNMSHEIRTPINAILGMNEMILRENRDDTIGEYAENIENAGRSLLGIVNDILDFSKIEAGRMEIVEVEYELASVLNDLITMIRKRAEDKGLILDIYCDSNIPHILYGDEIRIKQVVTNILTNAVKYTESGTVTMKVEFEKTGESDIGLKFSVRDTGIGMKDDEIEKLFDDYARLDQKRNRTVEGTGLGMGITRNLLGLMNSSLHVESTYGEGSLFYFTIPQKVVKWEGIGEFEEAVRRYSSTRKGEKKKITAPEARVLIVEDTRMNLSVMKGLLKQTKVRIETAYSGFEALAYTQNTPYDIIFLDHRMPGMDGIETLHRIREQFKSPNQDKPVIVLTANAVSGAREEYFREGFTDYLSKPVDSTKLEEMMIKYIPAAKVSLSEEDVAETPVNDSSLPEEILAIDELDTTAGVMYCGDEDAYLGALQIFAESADEEGRRIRELYENEEWDDYTTKVHALKSSARIIGAGELSALAKKMEDAGNALNITLISDNTDRLLEMYEVLSKKLSDVFSTDESDDRPIITEEMLSESYEAIAEFAGGYDLDSIGFVLDTIKEYRIPEELRERHEALLSALRSADWDGVKEILS